MAERLSNLFLPWNGLLSMNCVCVVKMTSHFLNTPNIILFLYLLINLLYVRWLILVILQWEQRQNLSHLNLVRLCPLISQHFKQNTKQYLFEYQSYMGVDKWFDKCSCKISSTHHWALNWQAKVPHCAFRFFLIDLRGETHYWEFWWNILLFQVVCTWNKIISSFKWHCENLILSNPFASCC